MVHAMLQVTLDRSSSAQLLQVALQAQAGLPRKVRE
jgi:hypothetical protein